MKIFFLIPAFGLAACSGFVKKGEVDSVKSVAIVSVYSNATLSDVRLRSQLGFGLDEFPELKPEDENLQVNQNVDSGLISFFEKEFLKELNKLGWSTRASHTLTGGRVYQNLKDFEQKNYVYSVAVPRKVKFFPLAELDDDTPEFQGLLGFAEKLGVDAFGVLELDIRFESYRTVGGTGNVAASVSFSFRAWDKKGEVILSTQSLDPGEGKRFLSQETAPMILGQVRYDKETLSVFQNALLKASNFFGEELKRN